MKKQLQNSFRSNPITSLFITLSVIFSVITWFGYVSTTLIWFVYSEQLILEGQIWRLITPIFLHFPALDIIFAHLIFNMIWLYFFGSPIERYESSRFLLLLIICSAVVSNIAQGFFSDDIFGGMSGVVYALLGYSFLRGNVFSFNAIRVQDNIAYFLIGYMLLAATGVFGSGIANTAHIVGFLVGLLLALFKSNKNNR